MHMLHQEGSALHTGFASDALFEALARSTALIQFDMDGKIICANDNFLHLMGYSAEEIAGQHHCIFMAPEEMTTREYLNFWSRLQSGVFTKAEFRRRKKTGEEVWIQATYNPVFDRGGKPTRILKVATDVTEQRRQSAECRAMIDAISESAAVVHFALDGTIISANSNFLQLMNYRESEIRGKHHSIFVDPAEAQLPSYLDFWRRLKSGAFNQAEFRRLRRDGTEVWLQASYNPILGPDGRPVRVVKIATDVTDLVRYREMVEHQALVDGLTGIANRRAFNQALEREMASSAASTRPLSLLLIDVDNFKSFNDVYGHQKGDECLRLVAEAVAGVPKRSGDLVARYGGEEFAVLLPNADELGAFSVAEQIRYSVLSLCEPHVTNRPSQVVTVSIGVSTFRAGELPLQSARVRLIQSADQALYAAKQQGRDRVLSAAHASPFAH